MPWLAAVAVAAGAVVGAISASGARDDAKTAAQNAWKELENLGYPPDLAAPLVLEHLKQQGLYDPKLEAAINQGVSQVAQIKEDPRLRDAQNSALQSLQQRGAGGLTAEDRLAFNELRQKQAQEAESKRQQIMQNMQARGMAGSGAELAAQLSSAQAADSDLASGGDRIAASASKNALEAMLSAGELGGKIRGQDFDVNRTRAAAEDEMNRFNIQNQMAVNQRNVSTQNDAQRRNLAEQQRIADANAGMNNAEQSRQIAAKQTMWNDKVNLAGMRANAQLGQASQLRQDANANAQNWSNIGNSAGSAIGTVSNSYSAPTPAPQAPQLQIYNTPNQQPSYAPTSPNFTQMSDNLAEKYPWLKS